MTNAVEYINSFSKSGGRIENLDRIKSLMSAVGNPQKSLRFIHVAGTNGKGSMCQMFSEILRDAGYITGLFTSPFIVEYSDRIKVNGLNISYSDIDEIMSEIRPLIEENPQFENFSQFEITQALAMCYFARKKCDIVVLEVGLGGLLDSTNLIENPLVSVIGSVSYDHTAILGETLEEIATQKAGIIKASCPVVLAPCNNQTVIDVVKSRAQEQKSQFVMPNLNLCIAEKSDILGSEFSYKAHGYKLSMAGEHQIWNALTVLEAINFVRETLPVSDENIRNGLQKTRLFGRVEILSEAPLTILDGSHNQDGTQALARFLQTADKNFTAIIGMHKDKNALEAVKNLVGVVDKFIPVDGFSPLEYSRDELAQIIENAGGICVRSDKAIEDIIARERGKNAELVICGSLYLVAYMKGLEKL